MKQTAVEWLESQLTDYLKRIYKQEIEEAKEIEKQQIIDAVSKGWDYYEDGKVRWIGEDYYNETFNK
jgi:hypothetical protein